ncbi:MAG: DNA polymerase domain-containing protein [Edaphobacter sp.]|uniref:DNA polymerase domain-containing protein n=1 Tax=Edaphobacter sp. TaxID=1934404 RepID=UPI00239F5841|nr:DNA polymerase domain-containing protein [Edaphobacter sp.]MDE1178700.1 DNA polymerase domain-containing protein [Edaphobacter sp.]
MSADESELLSIDGHQVRVSHPEKLYFSQQVRVTKLDLVRYYLAVAPGALQGIRDRPIVLKRFVNGAEAEPFYQKRAPSDKPAWMRSVTLSFPSGRTAEEIVVDDAAGLAWIVNLGCMELHPHPVRTGDLDHPDELRVDLDPQPGVGWDDVRRVAMEVKTQLEEVGLRGWPKTSGSRGIHINVRIAPRWTFTEVRRAALALSRAVERRVPQLASSKWWKEERHGVFLDYNQNAKDRTTCSAYSVRPLPDARVSTPLAWDEVMTCDAADFTIFTVPDRFTAKGNLLDAMDSEPGSLDALLDLAARDEASGLGDAPWPPHFRKMEGEGARVAPSRAKRKKEKSFASQMDEGFGEHRFRGRSKKLEEESGTETDPAAKAEQKPRRTRVSSQPLIIVAQSPDKAAAEAGLERWKQAHPEAAALLAVDDVLVDRMRGASYVWYRIRVNLRHVPEEQRPQQQTPDPDDDPTRAWREGGSEAAPKRTRKKKPSATNGEDVG